MGHLRQPAVGPDLGRNDRCLVCRSRVPTWRRAPARSWPGPQWSCPGHL